MPQPDQRTGVDEQLEERSEDLVDWIEKRLDGPLSDPVKVLEVQYERALDELVPLLLGCLAAGEESERLQRLARRITRHFLFNYYFGFMLFKFSPSYRGEAVKTARQRLLEDAFRKLAWFEPARQLMAAHFAAALEQRLHKMLREFLGTHKRTFHPRHAFLQTATRIGLADIWERLGRYSQDLYQGLAFGLSGFYLLFKSTGVVRPQEFETLVEYAHKLVREGWWGEITDVVRVLTIASLSSEQQERLLDFGCFLLGVGNVAHDEAADERYPLARIEEMGPSPPTVHAPRMAEQISERQLREASRIGGESRPSGEQSVLWGRREEVARFLGILANQNLEALAILREGQLLEVAVASLLTPALRHLPVMEALAHHLGQDRRACLSDDQLKTLRESKQLLDKEPAEFLLHLICQDDGSCPWPLQILENASGLTEDADRRLAAMVQEESNVHALCALIQICLKCEERGDRIPRELEGALCARLMTLLFDLEVYPRSEWIPFLGIGAAGPLLEVLERIYSVLREGESSSLHPRSLRLLHEISCQAQQMPQPDVVTLAACWRVDPDDQATGCTLVERVQEAISLLRHPTDRWTQEIVAGTLCTAIAQCASARRAIANSLRTMRHPDLALPLLEELLDIAATGDWYRQNPELYGEAFKSVVALQPLTRRALLLLEHGFIVSGMPESRLGFTVTPAFVQDQIMPLLVHEVSPDAVSFLVDLVWRLHCSSCSSNLPMDVYERPSLRVAINEKIHRYLHISYEEGYNLILLCALQSLANVPNLSMREQRVIWRIYRTSWNALIKSLSLLILSRQRPLREETTLALIRILKEDPFAAFFKTSLRYLFRSLLFRIFHRESPPDADLNYTFLCQGVAVNMITALLRQQRDDIVVKEHRQDMEEALLSTVSSFRYSMEPHLTEYTSLGTYAWGTKAMAQMMGATPEESEHVWSTRPSWIAQPADLAYQALHDLRTEKVL